MFEIQAAGIRGALRAHLGGTKSAAGAKAASHGILSQFSKLSQKVASSAANASAPPPSAGRVGLGYPQPPAHLERTGLSETIKDLESMQETVRNKRQMASTAFQNFDQKANQMYNLLSSVMKTMNEMRMGTVRNML